MHRQARNALFMHALTKCCIRATSPNTRELANALIYKGIGDSRMQIQKQNIENQLSRKVRKTAVLASFFFRIRNDDSFPVLQISESDKGLNTREPMILAARLDFTRSAPALVACGASLFILTAYPVPRATRLSQPLVTPMSLLLIPRISLIPCNRSKRRLK